MYFVLNKENIVPHSRFVGALCALKCCVCTVVIEALRVAALCLGMYGSVFHCCWMALCLVCPPEG